MGETVSATSPSLAERLGYGPDAKLLIVNCDDLGSSASANRATAQAMTEGLATSATLMVPCPWALDAVKRAIPGGIGVHLTLTCEYPGYRWRSLTGAASLHDDEGYMPLTAEAVWRQADLDEVRAECRAQKAEAGRSLVRRRHIGDVGEGGRDACRGDARNHPAYE